MDLDFYLVFRTSSVVEHFSNEEGHVADFSFAAPKRAFKYRQR